MALSILMPTHTKFIVVWVVRLAGLLVRRGSEVDTKNVVVQLIL